MPRVTVRDSVVAASGARVLPATARASVALPGARSELRTFPLRAAGPDEGWLKVDASGVCGTDVGIYAGGVPEPTVLGHHVVGRIAEVGAEAAARWGVAPGDRVVLEEYLPCGRCPACAVGRYRLCPDTDLFGGAGRRVGTVPAGEDPGLWGGNAEYVFLSHRAVPHPLPDALPDTLAAWVLPYANAVDWTVRAGGARTGSAVVVLGPGYHGLAVTAAARWAGAGAVVVAGLARDARRLAMAAALGARTVVADDPGALADAVRGALGGARADLVVDAVGPDPRVVDPALRMLGHGGRLVLTTPKQPADVPFDTRLSAARGLTVTSVRGRPPEAIGQAAASLADGSSGLQALPSAEVPLSGVGDMLARLAAGTGPDTPHVVVRPHLPEAPPPPPRP